MKSTFLLLALFASLLFVACETVPFEVPTPRDRTYLHFINAFDGFPGVDMQVESFSKKQDLVNDLGFLGVWPRGGYASLLTVPEEDSTLILGGNFLIEINSTTNPNSPISQARLVLNPDIRSTLALVDSFGKPVLVKTIDNVPSFGGDVAMVRFMNVNDSNLSVSLQTADTNFEIPSLNFLNYSSFRSLNSGIYSFYFINDFSKSIIDSISNYSIERGQIYNFIMAKENGKPVVAVEKLE